MILEEETFKRFGYYSYELSKRSGKKIVVSCDICHKNRIISKHDYRELCRSCSSIGRTHSEFSKQKMRKIALERSEKTKQNISEGLKGRVHSEETKNKISKSVKAKNIKGINHPMYGKHHTEETKQKLSEMNSGENHPQWRGGISYEPYCIKFNDDLKERVRIFFDRKCYLCDKTEMDNGQRLSVHHVNYDKMVCCNDIKPLFVPLCKKCHNKTNFHREYWQEFFTISLEYLTNGECYLERNTKK